MRVRTLLNPFKCNIRYQQQSWQEIFPDYNGTLDVEIGFGNGKFIEHYVEHNRYRNLVGFEIRHKHVVLVQEKIITKKLSNVVAFRANASFGLTDMFENGSIDRIFIFHPDPWSKNNQQKRRLINLDFLSLAHQKLKPNGMLYIATDVEQLWQYMLTTIQQSSLFDHFHDEDFWQTHYHTRWKEMSIDHQRSLWYGTFQKKIV